MSDVWITIVARFALPIYIKLQPLELLFVETFGFNDGRSGHRYRYDGNDPLQFHCIAFFKDTSRLIFLNRLSHINRFPGPGYHKKSKKMGIVWESSQIAKSVDIVKEVVVSTGLGEK